MVCYRLLDAQIKIYYIYKITCTLQSPLVWLSNPGREGQTDREQRDVYVIANSLASERHSSELSVARPQSLSRSDRARAGLCGAAGRLTSFKSRQQHTAMAHFPFSAGAIAVVLRSRLELIIISTARRTKICLAALRVNCVSVVL